MTPRYEQPLYELGKTPISICQTRNCIAGRENKDSVKLQTLLFHKTQCP